MKNNTFVALLLTFLALLLVLSATVVFLYQDRRRLLRDVDQLHLDATVIAVQAQQTVADTAVQNAGMVAAATASHNALVDARATQAAMSARVATLEAAATGEAAAIQETVEPEPSATPPTLHVTIIAPEDGASLPAGEAVDVIAFAAYPLGIDAVEVLLDDEPLALAPSEGPYRVITTEEPLDPEPGIHTLTVTVTGADNQSSSAAVSFTVLPPPSGEDGEGENGS